ncbi:hypothetical protein Q7P37_003045 [Cladosporium fusiforme]
MRSIWRAATARILRKAKGISSAPKATVLLTRSQTDGGIPRARSYHDFRPRAYKLPKSGERRIGTRAFMKATEGQQARVETFNTAELLELILFRLSAEQLYRMLLVSRRFRQVILASTRIRVKVFLDQSRKPREPWKLMEGVHAATQFRSVGHWFHSREPLDIPAPLISALAPHTFTPAILHPVFRNGPWDIVSRREAIKAAPWSLLDGTQRWVSAAMLPASLAHSLSRKKNILLDAFTSGPPGFEAVRFADLFRAYTSALVWNLDVFVNHDLRWKCLRHEDLFLLLGRRRNLVRLAVNACYLDCRPNVSVFLAKQVKWWKDVSFDDSVT